VPSGGASGGVGVGGSHSGSRTSSRIDGEDHGSARGLVRQWLATWNIISEDGPEMLCVDQSSSVRTVGGGGREDTGISDGTGNALKNGRGGEQRPSIGRATMENDDKDKEVVLGAWRSTPRGAHSLDGPEEGGVLASMFAQRTMQAHALQLQGGRRGRLVFGCGGGDATSVPKQPEGLPPLVSPSLGGTTSLPGLADSTLPTEDMEGLVEAPSQGTDETRQSSTAAVAHSEVPETSRRRAFRSTLRSSLGDRLKRLERKGMQKREEQKATREQDLLRKQFNSLPPAEADAIQHVFERFDLDGSGFLEHQEVMAALRELGLRGTNLSEKREILKICRNPGQEDDLGDLGVTTCSETIEDKLVVAVDVLRFALQVVPRVRARLTEMQSNDLLRYFFQYDLHGTGRLRAEQCMEIGRALRLDLRVLRTVLDDRQGSKRSGIDIEEFRAMVVKCREQVERTVRFCERRIKDRTGISDEIFQEFRQDIVNLYDLFSSADADESGQLSGKEISHVLAEFGFLPRTAEEREELEFILKNADVNNDSSFNFEEFLHLTRQIREYQKEKKRMGNLLLFQRYDRDGNRKLTIEEISQLLVDVGAVPRNRREQEELAALIQLADEDGSGSIDFEEFQLLNQRIEERLKSLRYEEEVEYALRIGFSESQLYDLRWVFDSLDADGSGKLDAGEVRSGLSMMNKKVSQEAFDHAFRALDSDGSGALDFMEFLDFIRLLRDGEGIFAEDGSNTFSSRVKFLELRVTRRVLEYFGLSKAYISSLGKQDVIDLFCFFFEMQPNDNLHEKLGVKSVAELFDAAKAKAGAAASGLASSTSLASRGF